MAMAGFEPRTSPLLLDHLSGQVEVTGCHSKYAGKLSFILCLFLELLATINLYNHTIPLPKVKKIITCLPSFCRPSEYLPPKHSPSVPLANPSGFIVGKIQRSVVLRMVQALSTWVWSSLGKVLYEELFFRLAAPVRYLAY